MKTVIIHLVICMFCLLPVSSLMADTQLQTHCDNNATVQLGLMGNVDQNYLDQEIAEIHDELNKRRYVTGLRFARKTELKIKLDNLIDAEQKLFDKLYLSGCQQYRQKASLNARLQMIETSMKDIDNN